MKILHSYWSKPYFQAEADKGGWSHSLFHYMSCAYSCLKFKEFFDIELITDKAGKEHFIDKLNLPYTSVKVALDDLNDYPPYLWAIGKLYSYSIQDEPTKKIYEHYLFVNSTILTISTFTLLYFII